MDIVRKANKEQDRFTVIIQKLIDQKILPDQVVIYMYYQKGNSSRVSAVSFFSEYVEPFIKNDVSSVAIKRMTARGTAYNEDHVCFSNIVTTTYGGSIVNNIFQPFSRDVCMAISKIVAASVLFVGNHLKGSVLNKSLEDKYVHAVTIAEFELLTKKVRKQ